MMELYTRKRSLKMQFKKKKENQTVYLKLPYLKKAHLISNLYC